MLLSPARISASFVLCIGTLLALPGVAAADTICVDPAGGGCETTIELALAAAVNGDTIEVHAGTYATMVNVTKEVTLLGPNHGVALDAPRAAEAEITGSFYLGNGNVTIDGFRFSGAALNPTNAKISGPDTVHLNDVVIASNRFDNLAQYAIGHRHRNIPMETNEQLQDTNWNIHDNTISEWTNNNITAILMWGIDNVQIHNNRIVQTLNTAQEYYGIQLNSSRHTSITGNHISGMSNVAIQVTSSWIESSDVTVSGNTITNTGTYLYAADARTNSNAGRGILIRGEAAFATSDIHVLGNTISNTAYAAIGLHPNSGHPLSDIEIDGNDIAVDASLLGRTFVAAIDLAFKDVADPHGAVHATDNSISFSGVAALNMSPVAIAVRGDATSVEIARNSIDGGGVAEDGLGLPATAFLLLTNETSADTQLNTGALTAGAVIQITDNDVVGFANGLSVAEETVGAYTNAPLGAVVNFAGNRVAGISEWAIKSAPVGGAAITADDNFWDCAGTIGAPGCPSAFGNYVATTYLVLGLTAAAPSVVGGSAGTTVTADLTRNNTGAVVSSFLSNGTAVLFSTNLGSIPATAPTAASLATATFTPGVTAGTATIQATLGGMTKSVDVVVTPAPTGGTTDGGTTTTPPTAPHLSELRLSRTRFRAATSGSSLTSKLAGPGTVISWKLDVRATVRFNVLRATPGRRSGTSCVAVTARHTAAKPCVRYRAVRGTLRRIGPAGAGTVRFRGRVASTQLRPGTYRLVARASGAPAGPKALSTTFTILR